MKNVILFEDFNNESTDIKPEKISYWEQVLNLNSNSNKYELEIIKTIKKTGKATPAQITVINKALRGDKKPYWNKN